MPLVLVEHELVRGRGELAVLGVLERRGHARELLFAEPLPQLFLRDLVSLELRQRAQRLRLRRAHGHRRLLAVAWVARLVRVLDPVEPRRAPEVLDLAHHRGELRLGVLQRLVEARAGDQPVREHCALESRDFLLRVVPQPHRPVRAVQLAEERRTLVAPVHRDGLLRRSRH